MCLGIPGQIVAIDPDNDDFATVEVSGVMRRVNIALLEKGSVGPGEWVLIHVGFAMARMDEDEAKASLTFLESLGTAFTDEVEALRQSGIEGAVIVTYIVDAAGLVEPTSIRIVSSDHPAFAEAVVASIGTARFTPGRVHGRPVRVLVRQVIRFATQP